MYKELIDSFLLQTCNNMGNCNCVAGWAPPVCLDKGWGGSVDGGGIGTGEEGEFRLQVYFFLNCFF